MPCMGSNRIFVDTWGWLVLANDRDPAFCRGFCDFDANRLAFWGAWVTTDYVLGETMTRLFSVAPFAAARGFIEGIFNASRDGLVDIEHVTPERFGKAWLLRRRVPRQAANFFHRLHQLYG